jgi:hypothetical protein
MKKFIIETEEKERILGMHKEATKTHYLNNLSESKNILNEQLALLNVPSASIIFSSSPGNAKQIFLKGTDPKTNKTSTLKYNVEGSYGFFDFDVNLRNFKRTTSGGLFVEAQPNNSMVQGIVSKLVPKEDLTKDGWIKSFVPKAKIDSAIALLKSNNGQSAEIDAGQGVTLNLTLAK